MNLQEAQQQLQSRLYQVYDQREASNIADWVLEYLTGMKKLDRLVHTSDAITLLQEQQLQVYTDALLAHKPVQYVLNEAWFGGLKFYVDENVLIPRPETEELVEWVVDRGARVGSRKSEVGSQKSDTGNPKPEIRNPKSGNNQLIILDIGTGSGCIPVMLKKKIPMANVFACDISAGALSVAKRNAATHDADIHFLLLDFLNAGARENLPPVDILVSNPPYIPQRDQATMAANVLQYEPHLALFVENDDPLLFYRHLAAFAQNKLKAGGAVYAEIHEDLGTAVTALFHTSGFTDVEIKKDMQGKERMVCAKR